MFRQMFVPAVVLSLVACGGGGGQSDDDLQFGETVPSEATLCAFAMGVTTRDQLESVLGDPTSFHDDPSGSSVQYWYGDAQVTGDPKIMLLGFFESAFFTQIPYRSAGAISARTRPTGHRPTAESCA
jgi:hypothetical protein